MECHTHTEPVRPNMLSDNSERFRYPVVPLVRVDTDHGPVIRCLRHLITRYARFLYDQYDHTIMVKTAHNCRNELVLLPERKQMKVLQRTR